MSGEILIELFIGFCIGYLIGQVIWAVGVMFDWWG